MAMTTKKFGSMMTTKRIPGSMIPVSARTTASLTRMTNTFTSDKKRTTRKPLTTMKAGGDVIEDTNVHENSVKIISMIENFIFSIQSESKIVFSIQRQGMLILKQIKTMR